MTREEAKKILLDNFPLISDEVFKDALIFLFSELEESFSKNVSGEEKALLRVEYPDKLHATFNGKTYRLQTNGYYEKREYLHTAVAEYYTGEKIPEGYVVHHEKKNEKGEYDKSQNDIEDLMILTASEHQKLHGFDLKAPIERKCLNCGKIFVSAHFHKKYCCIKCRSEYKTHVLIHEKIIERECKNCGEKFLTHKSSRRKYCDKHYHGMGSKRK